MKTTSNRLRSVTGVDAGLLRVSRSEFRVPSSKPARSAFTLVEMLVVIAIIAILAALISPAVYNALFSARQTKIKVEVDQLASAIEAYKAKYGSYPPSNLNMGDMNAAPFVVAHIARVFPRYVNNGNVSAITTDLASTATATYGADTAHFNPANAIMFWLQGFSPDVTNPFTGNGTRTPIFDFDKTRVTADANGFATYFAPYGSAPYVYINYLDYYSAYTPTTSQLLNSPRQFITVNNGTIEPYVLDVDGNGKVSGPAPNSPVGTDTFAKPTSFQIISAGQDGNFGGATVRLYPIGVGYDPAGADDDNVTNFCEKSSLSDAKP